MEKNITLPTNINRLLSGLPAHLPLVMQAAMVIFFIAFFTPRLHIIGRLSAEIREKGNSLASVEKGSSDVSQLRNELQILEKKAVEYDQRLPILIETNMLIDSLKAVTREASLRFYSIEPLAAEKFDLPYSGDSYYRLPIRIKLECGYYELVNFVQKIEKEKKLMKVSSLTISSSLEDPWEHNVELVISTYARMNKNK